MSVLHLDRRRRRRPALQTRPSMARPPDGAGPLLATRLGNRGCLALARTAQPSQIPAAGPAQEAHLRENARGKKPALRASSKRDRSLCMRPCPGTPQNWRSTRKAWMIFYGAALQRGTALLCVKLMVMAHCPGSLRGHACCAEV